MAAAAGNYKRLLQLLEKWPLDETKAGRDLGQFLRDKITIAYKENKFETNFKYWDEQYLSLQRLVDNESKNKYPRRLVSSASGLNAEECKIALSNDFLEELQEEEQSIFRRFFSTRPSKPQ